MLRKIFSFKKAGRDVIAERVADRCALNAHQLYHYIARSQTLWQRTAALQDAYPDRDSLDFAGFVDTEAVIYIESCMNALCRFHVGRTWPMLVEKQTFERFCLLVGNAFSL